MTTPVIATHGLTVYYGRHRGIIDLDLSVEGGEVFGFLGPNGAGKTTTLRVLLDIIRPTHGRATIFGLDCQREGIAIRRQVGYLPGELSLYPAMTGRQFLDMMGSVRGQRGRNGYRSELCQRLDLDLSRRISEYSRGNKQKLGLVAALMNKPDVLVLDEPTTGLDPLVQQTVLELVREARAEGRTVFFSSHILPEVEAVCDRVAIIREGRLAAVERVDNLTAKRFHRLHFTFGQMPAADVFTIEGVTETGRQDHSVDLEVRQNLPAVMQRAAQYEIVDVETRPLTLEEIFLAYYSKGQNGK